MKIYDISRLPNMILLGFDGENNWRPQSFDVSPLLQNHPNGTISLWLLPDGEAQAYPVALTRDGSTVVWTPLSEEMTARTGALQIVCTDGTDVGKSRVALFRVDSSILPGADHPAAVPSWATQTIERAEDAADRAEAAAESIDIDAIEAQIAQAVEDYLEEHPVEAPVQSVNGKTGAVVLDASDVGALPSDTVIPPAVTEQDVAGWGFTKNTGTYSKPSGGIPKTDLAADVQTSLGIADTALQPDALQTELEDNVHPARFVLVRNGNTLTTVDTFISIAILLFSTPRRVMFFIVASQSGGTVTSALELYPTMIDANSRALTLVGYFDGNRYTAELTAASVSSTMEGTLVVEPIVTESDIPPLSGYATETWVQNRGYQTAAQVQSAIAAIPDELPNVTAADNGKFLRVVNGAWAAQTVPAAESNSFGGGS